MPWLADGNILRLVQHIVKGDCIELAILQAGAKPALSSCEGPCLVPEPRQVATQTWTVMTLCGKYCLHLADKVLIVGANSMKCCSSLTKYQLFTSVNSAAACISLLGTAKKTAVLKLETVRQCWLGFQTSTHVQRWRAERVLAAAAAGGLSSH